MVLPYQKIKEYINEGRLIITNKESDLPLHIGPSSLDLHLGSKALILKSSTEILDTKENNDGCFEEYDFSEKGEITIKPGEFYIMSSQEIIDFPNDLSGFIQGRSSLARLGLNIHAAGFFDPGFRGQATLEISNFTNTPIKIYLGMRVCQMVFVKTTAPSTLLYKDVGKYNHQSGPTMSKIHEEN